MGIIIVVLVIIFIVWKIKKIKDVQNEQEIYCLRCGSSQVHIKTRGYSFGNFVVSTIFFVFLIAFIWGGVILFMRAEENEFLKRLIISFLENADGPDVAVFILKAWGTTNPFFTNAEYNLFNIGVTLVVAVLLGLWEGSAGMNKTKIKCLNCGKKWSPGSWQIRWPWYKGQRCGNGLESGDISRGSSRTILGGKARDNVLVGLCATGTVQEIQTAIRNGANVNARGEDGGTALIMAARFNSYPEIISILLKYGADAHAKDSDGKRAIDYASENESLKNTDAYQQLVAATPTAEFVSKPVNSIKCIQCGNDIVTGEKFCSSCGIEIKRENCNQCDNELKPNEKFCAECGTKIGEENRDQDVESVSLSVNSAQCKQSGNEIGTDDKLRASSDIEVEVENENTLDKKIAKFESRNVDRVCCPYCETTQKANRNVCRHCGVPFIFEEES